MNESNTVLGIDAAVFAGLVAEAIDQKMMGRGLTKAITEAFGSYNVRREVERVLSGLVREAAAALIQEHYSEAIQEAVRKEVTEDLISDAAAKSFNALKRSLDDEY